MGDKQTAEKQGAAGSAGHQQRLEVPSAGGGEAAGAPVPPASAAQADGAGADTRQADPAAGDKAAATNRKKGWSPDEKVTEPAAFPCFQVRIFIALVDQCSVLAFMRLHPATHPPVR